MNIRLQGKWEAERVAHCLKVYYSMQPTSKYWEWSWDCAERIEAQVKKARKCDVK